LGLDVPVAFAEGTGVAEEAPAAPAEAAEAAGSGVQDAAADTSGAADAQGASAEGTSDGTAASVEGSEDTEGAADLEGSEGAEGLEGVEDTERATIALLSEVSVASAALPVGSNFQVISDEGYAAWYRITSETTVQLGTGEILRSRDGSLDNLTPTIDPYFSGVLSVPATVSHEGVSYAVTAIASNAFRPIEGYAIPYRVSGLDLPSSVTTIGGSAFVASPYFKTLSYRDGSALTTIGSFAFSATTALSSFEIPNSVTSLGEGLFRESSVQSVTFQQGSQITTLPASFLYGAAIQNFDIPYDITTLGTAVFSQSALRSIRIPPTVRSMGSSIFSDCSYLSEVIFEQGMVLQELPSNTFFGCTALQTVTLPYTVTSIGASAFRNSGLTSFTLPATVNNLGANAFYGCAYLTDFFFASGTPLIVLPWSLFEGCTRLAYIQLPPNLRTLSNRTFANCSSLLSISLPRYVSTLGEFTFQGCYALRSVVFEGDANYLDADYSTFYLCGSLKSVVYWGKASNTLLFISSNPDIYYTVSYYQNWADVGVNGALARYCVKAYAVPETADPGDVFIGTGIIYASQVPAPPVVQGSVLRWMYEDGQAISKPIVESYYAYARAAVPDLIPGNTFTINSVEGIPVTYQVLTDLNTGTSRTVMAGTLAPGGAIATNSVGSVTLPDVVVGPDVWRYNVTGIAPGAFADCTGIVKVSISSTVTDIGANAFRNCSALRVVIFNGNANTINNQNIFTGCPQIETVVFAGKKANIGFGTASPKIYYLVRFYASNLDRQIDRRMGEAILRERAILDAPLPSDIYSGAVPELPAGFRWALEDGFDATRPLEDSCYAVREGLGFQAPVPLLNSADPTALCWFKVLSLDEATNQGTVQVGLGVDGLTAVHTSTRGIPEIPITVDDELGNSYTVVSVGPYAFGASDPVFACQYVTSVLVPAGLRVVDEYAFFNCQELTNISLGAQIERLGEGAFSHCTSLRSFAVDTAAPLKSIPKHAFNSCGQLLTFDYPLALEYIGVNAFEGCRSLRAVTFPAGFKELDEGVFFRADGIRTLTFAGDADKIRIGSSALVMDWSLTVLSKLHSVYFLGKKKPHIEDDIWWTNQSGLPVNNYGRTWDQYFTLTLYWSAADKTTGTVYDRVTVREGVPPIQMVPAAGQNRTWSADTGFSMYAPSSDSFAAFGGRDIGDALVSGIAASYSYTGDYIRPIPILTMPDGTVLRYGVDYLMDTTKGMNRDGYVNNRHMGTAELYLIGINDFAGIKAAAFEITGTYDAASVLQATFNGRNVYTYSGAPIAPEVTVTALDGDEARTAVENKDYLLSYRNNVNADSTRGGAFAQVVVTGLGRYGGEAVFEFSIQPYPLSRCQVDGSVVITGTEGSTLSPHVTVNHQEAAYKLMEGVDYEVDFDGTSVTRGSIIYVRGKGNYGGVRRLGFGVSSGSGGGVGGGIGSGVGPGTGSGSGPGTGNATAGAGNIGESAPDLQVGGGGGSGGKTPSYSLAEIEIDEIIDERTEDPTAQGTLWIILPVVLVLLVGATWRYRNYRFMLGEPKGRGEVAT
jgi:hypothetical protein